MRGLVGGTIVLLSLASLAAAQDLPLKDLLIPGEGWELVAEGYKFTDAPAANARGEVFFADGPSSKIFKIEADGKITEFISNSNRTSGAMFGPDGALYACQAGKQRIAKYDAEGNETVIAQGLPCNDLVVTSAGGIYVTDFGNNQVWFISPSGEKRVVDKGITKPNGLILSPDESTLVVAEFGGEHLWAFRVENDGSLSFKAPYCTPQLVAAKGKESGSDGMTVDKVGRMYVATHAGLQVFDTQGRLAGIIASPQKKFLSNVTFGGPKFDTIYATSADKVYRRRVNAEGARVAK